MRFIHFFNGSGEYSLPVRVSMLKRLAFLYPLVVTVVLLMSADICIGAELPASTPSIETSVTATEPYITDVIVNAGKKIIYGKKEFLLFGDLTAYWMKSHLVGRSRSMGGKVDLVIAPTINFDNKIFLIILNSDSYRRSKQVYAQDRGPKLFSESAVYNLNPTIKYIVNRRLAVIPSYIYTDLRLRQSKNESWGGGLYSYKDRGAGLDFSYELSRTSKSASSTRLAFQFYHREYPNFKSLLSISGKSDMEEKEKDYRGILVKALYDKKHSEGLSYKGTLTYLRKKYLDKKIERSDGDRNPEKQRDEVYTFGGLVSYSPKSAFSYRLNSVFTINKSNQNFAKGTAPDITFTPNYYGYWSFTLNPSVSYVYKLSNGKPLITSVSITYTRQKYADREAEDSSGNKTGERELDRTKTFALSSVYRINKRLSAGVTLDWEKAISNNLNEGTFLYNYRIFNASAGFTFHY